MLLLDKVVLITGAGSGIGECAAKLFAKEGARVAVADYNWEEAKRVSDEINEMYSDPVPPMQNNDSELWQRDYKAIAVHVNVADRTHVENMVWDVTRMFGKIDILINNAGITRDARIEKMTYEDWDRVIETNLTGMFNVTKVVLPHMLEAGYGKIINTSSCVGVNGGFGQVNYSSTKAAVEGFTRSLAKEVGKKGINVNAVAPGFIATPMVLEKMPEKVIKKMEDQIPLGHLGEPIDIAQVYKFLASDESKYVHGSCLVADGGILI
jgi:3-oxoacyl-[acyl-carrier protein] reductase